MIELLQQTSGLIGSLEDIKALSQKDHARILAISDSHGSYRIFAKIIKEFGSKCDALIFAGDGARDLAEILEEANEREDFRKCLPPVIAFVRGNNDPNTIPVSYDIGKYNLEARTLLKGSVIIPYSQSLNVNGHNILITHGHLQNIEYSYEPISEIAKEKACKTVIYGHTHFPQNLDAIDIRLINPGSISRPRGGMPATFAILTVEKTFINTAFLKINNPLLGSGISYSVLKGI